MFRKTGWDSQRRNKMNHGVSRVFKNLGLLLIVVLPLFSLGLSNHGLWSADEPRVAEIGREMALTGNWAVPTLNQRPFLEQPPLHYGVLALTFKAFGVSDTVARIPSAVFGFASVLVVFFMANSLWGSRTALLSGLVLATTGEFFRVAHTVIVDGSLTFFVMSTMGLFITGYLADSNRRKILCYVLMYGACSLAFLAKGFIGVIIPGIGILVFLAADRNLKEIGKMRLWLGVLIFLAMVLPWFIGLWRQGGTEHLMVFLFHNHLQRFLPSGLAGSISGDVSGHHHPIYYYLIEFPIGFLPWTLILVPALIHAFSRSGTTGKSSDKGLLFSKCWFFAGLVFLTISSTKRTLYLMPIFAPIAMITAVYIESTLVSSSVNRVGKVFLWVLALVLFIIGAGAIPGYLYAKNSHVLASSGNLLIPVGSIAVLMVASSFMAIRYLWSGSLKRYWVAANIPIIGALIFVLTVIVPVVDRHKSFVPFCNRIMDTIPADQPLYAYDPDETLRGAVPFYTGRYLVEVKDLDSLRKIIETDKPFFIITRDKRRRAENELLSTGKLSIVFQEKMGVDRTLTIFKEKDPTEQAALSSPRVSHQWVEPDVPGSERMNRLTATHL